MEQVVLGIFQEQLSKVIVGFRKEQINANILNGKGEIRDVTLNCQMLNDKIAKFTPYIELEEIHVSRLGFHVTSWTNLRKAPIIVDVGHITAKAQEPLRCLPRHQRRKLEMITEAELIAKMLTEGFKPMRAGKGSYGLVDRIVDNMTIEMESLTLEYQTWGKFKTQRIGQWTPPALVVKANNLKVVMVDEEGSEGTPDQVWNHNRNQRETFMLYKKVSGECQILLRPNDNVENENDDENDNCEQYDAKSASSSSSPGPLKLAETKMEIQMAVQRRLRDGAILAVQIDVTLPSVDVAIDSKGVHELAHFTAGLQYCFAKDRSFDDPLRSKAESDAHKTQMAGSAGPTVRMLSRVGTTEEQGEDESGEKKEGSGNDAPSSSRDRANTGDDSVEGTMSIGNTSADADAASVISWQSEDDRSFVKDSSNHDGRTLKSAFGSMGSSRHAKQGSNRPVVILPNGLVIYKSASFTCAMHELSVRGFYPHAASSEPTNQDFSGSDDDGYIEFIAKGLVSELIWPKIDHEPGLYAQLSTSFVSLQERFRQRKRTVLLGGMQRDDHLSLHLPSGKPQEIGADEFFPLFERRGIRDDPLDLRHLFPTQAMGAKTTIDAFKHKVTSDKHSLGPGEFETKYKVLHELGVDEIDIVLDTDIFHRMTRFFLNEDGEGFDPRWHTGDWTDLLTPEMLHHPSEVLDLDLFLQEPKEVFLDDHQMISSDLFNMTARLTNVEMKVPAAVCDNLRACDIAMKWKETTCVISSALPRTFLSGKIGNSITGDTRKDSQKGIIDFPNDPSDICFKLDKEEDPVLSPVDSGGKTVSTFRVQVTTRGFEMNIFPIIPFCKALEPRQLLAISNSTAILCFEGEPPSCDNNQIKITLFISILVHDLTVNLDLDLLVGSICTILYHKDTVFMILDSISNLFPPSPKSNHTSEMPPFDRMESSDSMGVKKSLKGRSILVRRHISQSRETGGLAIVFCMQQNSLIIRGWRQNVPVNSPLRDITNTMGSQRQYDDGGLVDIVSLLDFSLAGFEVGVEFDFHVNKGRRTVLKCCLDTAILKLVDPNKEMTSGGQKTSMIDFCSFGDASLPGGLELFGNGQQFALRLEGKHTREAQSWSLAADITSPSRIHLHAEAFKNVSLLVMEALLLPSWSKSPSVVDPCCPFPPETIGCLFHSLFVGENGSKSNLLASLTLSDLVMEDSTDPIVERCLRSICRLILPSDLHVILLRCEIANFLVSIPSAENEDDTKNLSFHLIQSDFISRFYPVRGSRPSEIEQVLACKGTNWSTLIDRQEEGFFQKMTSRQALLSFTDDANAGTKVDTVIDPFEVDLMYTSGSVHVSMSQGLQIDDIRRIESFKSRLKAAIVLSSGCFSELLLVAKSLKHGNDVETHRIKCRSSSDEKKVDETMTKEFENPSAMLHRSGSFLHHSGSFLQMVSKELLLYEEDVRNALRKRDDELEALKIELFLKERERFGAIALMSSRVAGWLKMGEQHRTGQRVGKQSLVWPYWTVLRKELLILYPSPGVSKPVDVVSLVNARLRRLAGGKSKQDTKRGFAIIEKNGMTRYFVARNAPEFVLWTKEITNTIRMCSDVPTIAAMDEEALVASSLDVNIDGNDEEDEANGGVQQKRGFGNRLASSFQSAKLKAKEMSERRIRAASTESLEDFDEDEPSQSGSVGGSVPQDRVVMGENVEVDSNTRRAQFGKKISGVGQATKNRLGSAIQSARQKGAEISSRRMRSDANFNGETGLATAGDLLGNSEPSKVTDQGLRRGLQIGNKLGSAIQNAKTGRLSGIREKIGGVTQRHGETGAEPTATSTPSKQDSVESDGQVLSYWTCQKCTFINDGKGTCEMCGNSRQTAQPGEITASPSRSQPMLSRSISQGALSDISETSEVIPEKDPRSFAQSTSIEQSNARLGSRFAFRKRQESTGSTLDDSVFGGDSFVLKNVYVSRQGFPASAGSNHPPPLKKLEGRWTVVVSSIPFKNHSEYAGTKANRERQNDTINFESLTESALKSSFDNQKDTDAMTAGSDVRQVSVPTMDSGIKDKSGISSCENPLTSQDPAQPTLFKLKVYRSEHIVDSSVCEKPLTRGDVLQFFSDVSETIETVLPQLFEDETFYEDSGNDAKCGSSKSRMAEKVLVFGRLLGGLLECEHRPDLLAYQCECIQGFLNSLLDCPLPVEALSLVSEMLGICASTTDLSSSNCAEKEMSTEVDVEELPRERPAKMLNLLSACQSEIKRAENTIGIYESKHRHSQPTILKAPIHGVLPEMTRPVCYQPVLPPSLTRSLHSAVQEALLSIMAERDEANAQLIGSNVMHINSLERERRKNEKLMAEAKMREDLLKIQSQTDFQPNLSNFFGKPDDRITRMRKEIDLKIEALHQVYRSHASTDEEMTQLCTQLANEISTKTSQALEIERLKVASENERKTNATERNVIEDELRRVKELLATEELKRAEAQKEAEKWKDLYEETKGRNN